MRTEEHLTVEKLLATLAKQPPDQAAWQEFTRRYDLVIRTNVARNFHLKRRQVPDRRQQFRDDLVDDLTQAVYVRLLGNAALPEPKSEYSVTRYLSIVATNVVRDYFREATAPNRPKITFSLDELLEGSVGKLATREIIKQARKKVMNRASTPSTSEHLVVTKDEVDRALQKAVSGPHRNRDILIFKLRYYDELTPREIQNALGLELSADRVHLVLQMVMRKLKAQLKPVWRGRSPATEYVQRHRASAKKLDSLLTRMQAPGVRKGMHAGFNATSDELGGAAVKAARKRR